MSLDHKDIGIVLFLIGLVTFFIWAARAIVLARRQEAEPAEAEPAEAEPAEAEPAEAEPAEAEPAEAEPAEAEPAEAKPAEAEPAEAEPAEAEPAEAKPAEAKPAEAEPAEAEPAEAEPAEAKPAEAKPAEAKPAEAEPAEAEPAEVPAEAEPEPAIAMPVPKPKAVPAPVPKKKRKELKAGLKKTRTGFIARLGGLFKGKKKIDAGLMDELEEVLFTADIGVRTSQQLFDEVKKALDKKELEDADAVWSEIKSNAQEILSVEAKPFDWSVKKPFVILTVGVNGVGKTTTIGKLAAKFTAAKKRCLLAAGDTFRAAAVEQLEVWGARVKAPVVKGKEGQDPSSVIFDAIKKAQDEQIDVVIADTAGRLHTKVNLMDELKKIDRVCDKAHEGAPHETLLVLDATTGQNAIQQANLFREVVKITGIVLTKLDGTAKGGIILGICDELGIPVRYIGIGEGVEDLREFDPEEFVDALFAVGEEPS